MSTPTILSLELETQFQKFQNLYESSANETDPRVIDFPLVWGDPRYATYILIAYVSFVLVGKRVMKNLPAVPVPEWILFVYNFGLVLLSGYMVIELAIGAIVNRYNIFCAEINYKKSEMRVTNVLWWYFFSKVIEFFDTFWMIIRKKFTQITFLHVFHHSSMFAMWWFVISFVPAGQAFFGAAINSCVHVVMYLYYALSVVPSLKEKLWWKKYITMFQLIQFLITLAHTSAGIFLTLTGRCSFPMWPQYLLNGYMVIMLVLFSNFYRAEYIKKSNLRRKELENKMNASLSSSPSSSSGPATTQTQTKKMKDANNNEILVDKFDASSEKQSKNKNNGQYYHHHHQNQNGSKKSN